MSTDPAPGSLPTDPAAVPMPMIGLGASMPAEAPQAHRPPVRPGPGTGRRPGGPPDRTAPVAIALSTAWRAGRSGAIWGLVLGFLVMNEATSYHHGFPTVAARQNFARTFGANPGLAAVTGQGRRLDTLEGFVAWRMFGLMIIVLAIWGLLTATRLLRAEEDAGRWELLLSGRTSRRRATVQALAGLGAGFLLLWAVVAGFTVVAGLRPGVGFAVSAALFYATATTCAAAMFLAIGALTGQLGATRRQANGLGAAVFGLSLLIRMVADTRPGLAWLRWASPLGWVENLHPLTGSQPLPLVPIVLLTAAAAAGAVLLAGRRDLGAGLIARRAGARADTRFLGGGTVLVARLERWVALAWIAGLAVLALIFGVVARSAGAANLGDSTVGQTVGRLGGQQTGAVAWIGYEFLYLAALVAFAAAGQVSALRDEESGGHLDNLLARSTDRRVWLLGRLGFGLAMVALIGLALGLGGWLGLAGGGNRVGLAAMLRAGLNAALPAVLVLGIGALLFGLAPRLAAPLLYGLILWSFVIELVGTSLSSSQWLLDSSVLTHLGPVPAADLNWTAIGWLTGLAVLAAAAGLLAFQRRDLASA